MNSIVYVTNTPIYAVCILRNVMITIITLKEDEYYLFRKKNHHS